MRPLEGDVCGSFGFVIGVKLPSVGSMIRSVSGSVDGTVRGRQAIWVNSVGCIRSELDALMLIGLTILFVNVEVEVTWGWIAGNLEVGTAVLGMVLEWVCSGWKRESYTRSALAGFECNYWCERHVVGLFVEKSMFVCLGRVKVDARNCPSVRCSTPQPDPGDLSSPF